MNKNPPIWEQDSPQSVKISCLNCHSLRDKFEDIQCDSSVRFNGLTCLSEMMDVI